MGSIFFIIFTFVFIYYADKMILLSWCFLHMFDDRWRNLELINPNDLSFFLNFDIFKSLVEKYASKDEVMNDYLKSRRERLFQIRLLRNGEMD